MKEAFFILLLSIQFARCMGQAYIEKELTIELPNDIKEVWTEQNWNKSNNVFTLYNFKPFYLLDPTSEDNIIHESKSLNAFLKSAENGVVKSVVIAKSFLKDDGQFLFYGFDEKGTNLGVWAWHLDQGPQFPSKISNNLIEIFESKDLLAKGFDESETISKLWIKATHGKLNQTDFSYGNFPQKDLRIIAEEICPEIIYFPNETTFLVDNEKLNEIDKFYSNLGRLGLKNEMKDEHLTELLKKTNMESFNIGNKNKIFIVQFHNSPNFGLCNCTKEQAIELNRFGYFSFYNLLDSEESSKFIRK